jgi:hypothetical protein
MRAPVLGKVRGVENADEVTTRERGAGDGDGAELPVVTIFPFPAMLAGYQRTRS